MIGPGQRILQEEADWDAIAEEVLGTGAQLVSVSRRTSDARLYRLGARAARIARCADPLAAVNLARQARTLRLMGLDANCEDRPPWQILTRPWLDGELLSTASARLRFPQRLALSRRVLREVVRQRRAGLRLGNLHPETIVVGASSIVSLGDEAGRFSLTRLLAGMLFPGLRGIRERLRSWSPRRKERAAPAMSGEGRPASSLHEIEILRSAWRMGGNSAEEGPYYAFTYQGVPFPGARPWYLRWEPIRRAIDFRGKRVVELGCNMGLLSSFATIHGAASAMGVDHSSQVVESARLVAQALGSGAEFTTVDLVADPDWEQRVGSADIVTMLSVMNWLPPETQRRALRFLALHGEVLYEGHDPLDVETARLRSAGFHDVRVLAETDRNRHLLYARASR